MFSVERVRVLSAVLTLAHVALSIDMTGPYASGPSPLQLAKITGRDYRFERSARRFRELGIKIIETDKDQIRNLTSDGEGRYAFPWSSRWSLQTAGAVRRDSKRSIRSGILLQVGNNDRDQCRTSGWLSEREHRSDVGSGAHGGDHGRTRFPR